MSGPDVLFLLVWFASTLLIVIAAFIYGWQYRDEHPPHPAMRTVVAAVLDDRPRVAAWLEGSWRVPVRWDELPQFIKHGRCPHPGHGMIAFMCEDASSNARHP
jgi:hypothetical protein